MTNIESLAKMNQRTIHSLIAFFVLIVFFHSTSYNAFVFGVQAFQRSPKLPSKTIQLTNNGPATKIQASCSFQMMAMRILSSFASQGLQHLLEYRQTLITTPI
jgi:hypothetical protein